MGMGILGGGGVSKPLGGLDMGGLDMGGLDMSRGGFTTGEYESTEYEPYKDRISPPKVRHEGLIIDCTINRLSIDY
jgi:hypothetical protein